MVVTAVLVMIFGAIVAAGNDLAFDFHSYCFILSNDMFTALYGVYTKEAELRANLLCFEASGFNGPYAISIIYRVLIRSGNYV